MKKIFIAVGLLVIGSVVAWVAFIASGSQLPDDVLVYTSFGVQGTVENSTLYTDGRLVRYCTGVPLCTPDAVGTTTYQVSRADMVTIEQVLSKIESEIVTNKTSNQLSESTYIMTTNYRGNYLQHEGSNEQLETIENLLRRYYNKTGVESQS